MYKKFTLATLLLSFLVNGCGSSDTTSNENDIDVSKIHEIKKTDFVKIERANWDNVAPLTDGFFVTNENETLSFKIQSPQIENGESFTEVVFIDADNNPETGYNNANWGDVGAEYLVQGNTLFSYRGTGWQWDFVSRIDRNMNNNLNTDESELEFDINLINLNQIIRATPFLLNDQWGVSQRFNSVTYTIENEIINNENNFLINDDELTITFDIQSQRIANNEIRTEVIFIDSDNDLTTGYNNQANWHSQLGAEYLIEGNTLFRYMGDGWNWNVVGRVERGTNEEHLVVRVNKDNIDNLSQTFSTTSYLLDNTWAVIQRYNTLSHANIEIAPPEDHGEIVLGHNINNFSIGLNGDLIRDNLNTEIYIDADHNANTGSRINGIGAEYRVINNELFIFRVANQEWELITNRGINRWTNPNDITTFIPRWRVRVGQNIAVSANLLDENNNLLYTYPTQNYEVRGDDDEITLSLDDPNFYIFTIHSDLIGVDRLGEAGNGEVRSLHMAMDWDNNQGSGHFMNDLGAEGYISSWDGALNRYVGPRNAAWWTQFERGNRGEVAVSVGEHTVEFRVPRDLINSENGIIRVASTFNNNQGHFYWTNGYEFDLNAQ